MATKLRCFPKIQDTDEDKYCDIGFIGGIPLNLFECGLVGEYLTNGFLGDTF